VVTRHADLIEPDPTVVDTVQAGLVAVVLDADSGHRATCVVADRNHDRVNPVVLALDDQLHEDGRHSPVEGRVPDPLLPGALVRRMHDELVRVAVEDRGRLDPPDVRSVRDLGHREAAGQLETPHRLQPAFVMGRRTQLVQTPTPEAELDAELDHGRGVPERQRLEDGDRPGGVAHPSELAREPDEAESFVGEDLQRRPRALPMLGAAQLRVEVELRRGQKREYASPKLCVRSRHVVRQGGDVDLVERGRSSWRVRSLCHTDAWRSPCRG